MNITGTPTAMAAGSQFYRIKEEPSTLSRMGSCLKLIYMSYLIATTSQSTLMYVCCSCKHILAKNYLRTITRSCFSSLTRKVLPAGILARNLITLNDLLISFYDGTLGRLF